MRRCSSAFFIVILLFICILCFAQGSGKSVLFISHISGNYNKDVFLQIETLKPGVDVRYSFSDVAEWLPSVPYREAIGLQALPGEEREYRLKIFAFHGRKIIEERLLTFSIDRKKPVPPESNIVEDHTPEEIEFRFTAGRGDRVIYSLNSSVHENPLVWDGSTLVLSAQDEILAEYFIQSYSEDRAGNKSRIKRYSKILYKCNPDMEVLSPVAGSFANWQMLYIRSRDMKWIRYTLDGSDPVDRGRLYTGPQLLKFNGDLRLRVVGLPKGKDKKFIQKSINFEVIPENRPSILTDTESGIYKRSLRIKITPFADVSVFYSLIEKTPDEYDLPVPRILSLDSIPSAGKLNVLRLRALNSNGEWEREYRYFYLIDRKKPQAPKIIIRDPPPLNGYASSGSSTIEILEYSDSTIYYTLDGSQPNASSLLYKKLFSISPKLAINGNMLIRAVAIGPSGIGSDTSELKIKFDTEPPKFPEVSLSSSSPSNKPVVIKIKAFDDYQALYEVSTDSNEPPAITENSAAVNDELILSIPYGLEKIFNFRFASVDAAGNISEAEDIISVHLDRLPPGCPKLMPETDPGMYDHSIKLSFTSSAKIFYEISQDDRRPLDPSVKSPVLKDKIELNGVHNNISHYFIKLLCQDDVGNLSEVYGPFHYIIDLRKPQSPEISELDDSGPGESRRNKSGFDTSGFDTSGFDRRKLYNIPVVNISFKEIQTPIFYTMSSDGTEPPDPDKNSTRLPGNSIDFKGVDEQEKHFWLKIITYSSDLERKGDIKSSRFTIDLKPPDYPNIEGVVEGKRYNNPVTVSIKPADPEDRVYISYTTSDSNLIDPVKYGEQYKKALNFDVEEGEETRILLRAAAVDRAGNRTPGDQYISFILDRKPPNDPEAAVSPINGLSNEAATISLRSDGGRIYYEMSDDGSMPLLPDIESAVYQSPLVLTGKLNQEITYKICARVFDDLGNASSGHRVYTVTVDRKAPAFPENPTVELNGPEHSNRYLISWMNPNGHRIYYRIFQSLSQIGDFKLYESPFNIELKASRTKIEFFKENQSGNRSKSVTFTLPSIKNRLEKPKISGILNGQSYNRVVNILLSAGEGRVRYELSTDGTEPPPVSASSAIANRVIRLDTAEGETLNFRIRARAFGSKHTDIPSEEVTVSCVIDRTPPETPVLDGAVHNGYYHEARRLRLLSSEGKIHYTIIKADRKPSIPDPEIFKAYEQEIILDTETGGSDTFWIAAYTIDEAGNRSHNTRIWTITIDKKTIFVSSQGNDLYEGTRSRPFKTLRRAISYSIENGRKIIHCALGEYYLERTLELSHALTLKGGFSPETWQREGFEQRSIFKTGKYFPKGSSLIEMINGQIHLDGFEFQDSKGLCSVLIIVSGGDSVVSSSKIDLGSRHQGFGVLLRGGSLKLFDSQFKADSVSKGSLLLANGGQLEVVSCEFLGPHVSDNFKAVLLENMQECRFININLNPGRGNRITGISIYNSDLSLMGSKISTGRGNDLGVAVELKNARFSMIDCIVEGDDNGNYSTAVLADNSDLSISKSRIKASAKYGAAGLFIKKGKVNLTRSRITSTHTEEFLYLVEIHEANGYFANNFLTGSESGQAVCALLADTQADWYNNTLIGGTGSNLTIGFMIKGNTKTRLINNIILRKGEETGTAIHMKGPDALNTELIANNVNGWSTILKINSSVIYHSDQIQLLNQHDGDIFGGNYHKNISEQYLKTFKSQDPKQYHLSPISECVNAGVDLGKSYYNGPVIDLDGQKRPAPLIGIKPVYDIGADEVY